MNPLTLEDAQRSANSDWSADRARRSRATCVNGLRVWGSDKIYDLPATSPAPLLVGASRECSIRLMGRDIAPEHAHLMLDHGQWLLRALSTSSGVRLDGVPLPGLALASGVEVEIGEVTLVAESEHHRRLRAFCQRLLGWGNHRLRAVDHALRAMRLARAHRTPLALCGEGDLVPIAYALHRSGIGGDAPFIVCDRRRHDAVATVRSPSNLSRGLEAFERATGGTLCLRTERLPADVDEVTRRAYEPGSDVQIVVCTRLHHAASLGGAPMIEIPQLQLRELELPRVVQEYAEDAIATLNAGPGHFNEDDRDWVMANCAQSLPEIEKATLRLVALSATRSRTEAAALLGMAPVSLTRWLNRRPSRSSGSRNPDHVVAPTVKDPANLEAISEGQ